MANRDVYARVFAGIVEAMERGVAPWRKPWTTSAGGRPAGPHNAISGRRYSGANLWALHFEAMDKGYGSAGWVTFKQALAAKCVVRKGEKATSVFYMSVTRRRVKDAQPDPTTGEVPSERFFFAKGYNVFNLDQLSELEPGALDKLKAKYAAPTEAGNAEDFDALEEADKAVKSTGARISLGSDRACYVPSFDLIEMPKPEDFTHRDNYYAVLFHELTHWTGHESRLNRLTPARFGSPDYAFEELVAELGSAFLCSRFGIEHIEPAASYLKGWASACREHPEMFARAASLAQRAVDFLLGETQHEETETEEASTPEVVTN